MIYWNNFKQLINFINNNENDNLLYTLTFQVTKDCNCQCDYCYENNKEQVYMDLTTGKKCIDFFFNNFLNSNIKVIGLNFIGGEPLLNLKVIDYICSYFIKQCCKYKKDDWLKFCSFSFITNGTLCNSKEFYNFIEKYKDYLFFTITIDGPEEVHNACRVYKNQKGTFSDVFNNWKKLQKKYPTCIKPETKITVSPKNLNKIFDMTQFFILQNFRNININPIFEYEWTYKDAAIYYQQLKKIVDIFFTNPNNIQSENPYINFKFLDKKNFLATDKVICKASFNTSLTFNTYGDIFNCIRFTDSINSPFEKYQIGNVENYNFNNNDFIISECEDKTNREPKCLNCPISSGCKFCPAYNYLKNGNLVQDNMNLCLMHKAEYLIYIYYQNKIFNNKIKNCLELNEVLKIIPEEELDEIYFT